MRALFFAIALFLVTDIAAQRTCNTEASYFQRTYTSGSSVSSATQQDTVADAIIYIPVVVHVLYHLPEHNISNAQVISQIEALNRDFGLSNDNRHAIPAAFQHLAADTRIRFCLARVDPMGRPSTGIVRKYTNVNPFMGDDAMKFSSAGGSDVWNPDHYLNIWVCNMFGRSLGYASVPGFQRELDGIVVNWDVFGTVGNLRAPYNEGRTATHEVGHWMGLKHIWGDAFCASDDVDDTPRQKSYNNGCPNYPKVSDCSLDGHGDMFMNYMDLTDDGCMSMFTHGQKIKMRSVFAIGGLRNEMLNAFQCDSTRASGAPLPPDPGPLPTVSVEVYPNPFVNHVVVETNLDVLTEPVMVQVYNMQGQRILQQSFTTPKAEIVLRSLPKGMYLIQVTGNGIRKTFKTVKL
jgi:hypothetical protein